MKRVIKKKEFLAVKNFDTATAAARHIWPEEGANGWTRRIDQRIVNRLHDYYDRHNIPWPSHWRRGVRPKWA